MSRRELHCVMYFRFSLVYFAADETSGIETATAMELEERDIEFLKGEAKSAVTLTGSAEMLDPADFKLPYMGKDKFIQLMRVGIKYNSSARHFLCVGWIILIQSRRASRR